MNSPVRQLREAWGLTISEFSEALGVQYNQAFQVEKGRQRLPRKAREALGELGVDVADLERRQAEWIEERARKLREELAGKIVVAGTVIA